MIRSPVFFLSAVHGVYERVYDQVLHHLFIDFKAAYDSIVRVQLYEAVEEFGIPNKLIRLPRMTMTDVRNKVKAKEFRFKIPKSFN